MDACTFSESSLTDWITAFVAVAVLGVGFVQWMATSQNVAVELFAHRMFIYHQLREAVAGIVRGSIETPHPDEFLEFSRACFEAEFLFGKDVVDYLVSIKTKFTDLNVYADDPAGSKLSISQAYALRNDVVDLIDTLPRKLKPYTWMTSKIYPWS